jgi:copper chaperone CopZ
MSRRRGEFEHRTSIFEGAFRAWSHLGGLGPEELENKPSTDLDPLSNPIESDTRLLGKKESKAGSVNPNGTKRRQFPYEPLPRSGLAHPYVQAVLSPWLGPDADNDAIQLGLTTLRTWWQHRRKGESGSAIAALGTDKMKGVVEGYTRHFFTLAHCLIINDKEQPPRTLHAKMKELEKVRGKRKKKRTQGSDDGKMNPMGMGGNGTDVAAGILNNPTLSPLERLHIAQQRQLNDGGGISGIEGGMMGADPLPIINIKNRCVPGKPDLPGIVDKVSRAATQLAHSGGGRGAHPSSVLSSGGGMGDGDDADSIPIVYISENRDIMIAMTVDGITCAHCVKIVETVLRGCNGNKSPIDGLLDAAADRTLNAILIRIDRTINARRIALEAARNLAMVGYTTLAKTMSSIVDKNGSQMKISHDEFDVAFENLGQMNPKDIFDWSAPCSCPDNGVARDDCVR